MKIFVVDSHAIYRRGIVVSLELLAGVQAVDEADDAARAAAHPAFAHADVVIVDGAIAGLRELVTACAAAGARVIVCAGDDDDQHARAALGAGAIGYLRKAALTPDVLQAALRAAWAGAAVIAPGVLAGTLHQAPADAPRPATTVLSDREQRVLTLIADGHPTREVATALCYSERTVKNVLHDAVTKLNARSRSHAIAYAVREGLI